MYITHLVYIINYFAKCNDLKISKYCIQSFKTTYLLWFFQDFWIKFQRKVN